MSVSLTDGQSRSSSVLPFDGVVGGLGQSAGVLAHRVAGDSQLAGNLAQREALNLGLLHRFPESEVSRGKLSARWRVRLAIIVGDVFGCGIEVQASKPR